MMGGLRNVIRPDGSVHLEHQVGTMRFDLADGSMTQVLPSAGGLQTVIRPDGSCGMEQTLGNMRLNLDRGDFDQLL